MRIVVETPKWSFRKRINEGDEYRKVFSSPIPTPFNYGFIEGTLALDGMPLDVILLGERFQTGSEIDVEIIGRVMFVDNGARDDKYIASLDGKRRAFSIWLFFTFYAFAKLLISLLHKGGWTHNRFVGIEWFEKEFGDVQSLGLHA